jgi:hypothetical protein
MATPEKRPPVESDSTKIAKIIVSDTLRSQQGNNETLFQTISALKGPRGNAITQNAMGDYLGLWPGGEFDARVLQLDKHNVNALEIKISCINLLTKYSRLPETERPAFLDSLTPQEAKRGQQLQTPRGK